MSSTLFLKSVVLLLSIISSAPVFAQRGKTIGIIGDSVATGAVSDDSIDAQAITLLPNFLKHRLTSPFNFKKDADFPENAFAAVVSSGLGVRSKDVFNVAVNGQRVTSIASQFTELMKKTFSFPDYLLVSYTANDACSENIFSMKVDEFKKEYARQVLEGKDGDGGLRLLARAAPRKRKTSIFLIASLNFPQVLTNESMDATSQFRRTHLKQIHQAMIEAQAEVVQTITQENRNPYLKVRFIESSAHVSFNGTHVANDCFHLSNQGQGTLGLAIWSEILSLQ